MPRLLILALLAALSACGGGGNADPSHDATILPVTCAASSVCTAAAPHRCVVDGVAGECLNIDVGAKALITCDNFFFAPDGGQYRAVFGTVKAVRMAEQTLGVNTGPRSATWYIEIGCMTIAGCQVNYAVRTDTCHPGRASDWTVTAEHGIREYERPCSIYFADLPEAA